jgi:hypothetical protein
MEELQSKKSAALLVIKLAGTWKKTGECIEEMVKKWTIKITIRRIILQVISAWSIRRPTAKSNLNGVKVERWKRITSYSAPAVSAP